MRNVEIDKDGRVTLKFLDEKGERMTLDLTKLIEDIAARKVQEHMQAWHGQNL